MTKQLLEEIYDAFSKYKLNEKITGCYCPVCLTEDFNKMVHSVPLKNIQTYTLGSYVSAVGITEGDCNDFKYFLPRILELIYRDIEQNEAEDFHFSIWSVLQGIDYSAWDPKEVELLIRFFELYWNKTKDADDPELLDFTMDSVKSTVFKSLAT
jgi:hypothetical protein